MKNTDKNTILSLGKSIIKDLTEELNSELSKVRPITNSQEMDNIFVECDGIMAKLNSRIEQFKSVAQKDFN